jgi:hypothetical protein
MSAERIKQTRPAISVDPLCAKPLDDGAPATGVLSVDFHPEVSRFFHREVSHL